MTIRLKPALKTLAAMLLGAPAMMLADEPAKPAEAVACENGNCNGEEKKEDPCPCGWLQSAILGDCFAEKTGLKLYGWINGGIVINDNGTSRHGPLTFPDREDPMLNQLYLVLERPVKTDGCKLDIGGRADMLYGSDAVMTQSFHFDQRIISPFDSDSGMYTLAIPQLYAQVFLPVGKGLDIKAGKFYTLIGYEVVTSPDNFFYTHSYSHQYGEPFTHTGVMASYQLTEKLKVHNCIVRGWDSWNDNNNALSYMGGITFDLSKNTTFVAGIITGSEQDEPNQQPWQFVVSPTGQGLNRTMWNVQLKQKLGEKLRFAVNYDNGIQNDGSFADAVINPADGIENSEWYGVSSYLIYDINDKWSAGMRLEVFRDDDASRIAPIRGGVTGVTFPGLANPFAPAAANYYDITLGLNWKPTNCITIRPEVRWDWQDKDDGALINTVNGNAFDGGTSDNQFTFGIDFYLKF